MPQSLHQRLDTTLFFTHVTDDTAHRWSSSDYPLKHRTKEGKRREQYLRNGSERSFVRGVTTALCRRSFDHPRAETHPPNTSMNVYLVNFRGFLNRRESWRLLLIILLCLSRLPCRRS